MSDTDAHIPMHKPVVRYHDSGLLAVHDQACSVCHDRKAILRIDLAVFLPCDQCRAEGWRLLPPKKWFPYWLRRMMVRDE